MGLLAAGSPRNGGGGIKMSTLMLGFLLVFAVVGYFGFERYRVQRESEERFKQLETSKRTEADYRRQIATLESENMELQAKIASHLKDLERYKQSTEEELKLDAERADEIDALKSRIKTTNGENQELKERVKRLELQLSQRSTGKNNSTTQIEEEKKQQGEDKDHGLAAEDKSETESLESEEQVNSATQDEEEAAKSGELDDRKREQQPQEDHQQQQQQQQQQGEMDDLDKVDEQDLDNVKAEVAKVDDNADGVADE